MVEIKQSCRSDRVFNWPVREPRGITEMTQVVDVTEQFVLELWKYNDGDRTVLVERSRVAL